jgi:hypothetical protein
MTSFDRDLGLASELGMISSFLSELNIDARGRLNSRFKRMWNFAWLYKSTGR